MREKQQRKQQLEEKLKFDRNIFSLFILKKYIFHKILLKYSINMYNRVCPGFVDNRQFLLTN